MITLRTPQSAGHGGRSSAALLELCDERRTRRESCAPARHMPISTSQLCLAPYVIA